VKISSRYHPYTQRTFIALFVCITFRMMVPDSVLLKTMCLIAIVSLVSIHFFGFSAGFNIIDY
jgi:hypothetical protein